MTEQKYVKFNKVDLKSISSNYNSIQKYQHQFFELELHNTGGIGLSPMQITFNFKNPDKKATLSSTFKWIERPTGNCQISTVGYVNSIIAFADSFIYTYTRHDPNSKITREDVLVCMLAYIHNIIYTLRSYSFKMLLLDINQSYMPLLDNIIKTYNLETKFKNTYHSTNGSSMCTYLIDVRHLVSHSIRDLFSEYLLPKEVKKELPKFDLPSARYTTVRKDTYKCEICGTSINPGIVYKAFKDNKYLHFHVNCYHNEKSKIVLPNNNQLPF